MWERTKGDHVIFYVTLINISEQEHLLLRDCLGHVTPILSYTILIYQLYLWIAVIFSITMLVGSAFNLWPHGFSCMVISSMHLFCTFILLVFFFISALSHMGGQERRIEHAVMGTMCCLCALYLLFSLSFLLYFDAQQCMYLFSPSCKGHRRTSGPWCRKNSACTDNISWILMGHFASSMCIYIFFGRK